MTNPKPVTDRLRRDILEGFLLPGERLVELTLADRYNTGRTTIRSAFATLEAEGLISREANRGATVRRISLDEAIEITEARSVLEQLIAAQAARRVNSGSGSDLAVIIDQMRAAVEANDATAYSAHNQRFHSRLREMSGNTVATELVENLRNRAAHHQYRLALSPDRASISLGQHAAIADAVSRGDESAASQAMEVHLASVLEVLRQWGDAPGV